jgi:tetratricopeptide (TPR) repeat protein
VLTQAEGYLELGLPASALELLCEWAARRPLDGHGYYLKGEALRSLQRHAEALAAFEQASQAMPDDFQIRLAMGWCYKRLGRLEEAIDALEQALANSPGEAILYYNLACYYSLAGEKQKAFARLARALEIDGDYRDLVGDEPDFDPVRDDPEFQRLTSIIV